jgi:hypothetical protein
MTRNVVIYIFASFMKNVTKLFKTPFLFAVRKSLRSEQQKEKEEKN